MKSVHLALWCVCVCVSAVGGARVNAILFLWEVSCPPACLCGPRTEPLALACLLASALARAAQTPRRALASRATRALTGARAMRAGRARTRQQPATRPATRARPTRTHQRAAQCLQRAHATSGIQGSMGAHPYTLVHSQGSPVLIKGPVPVAPLAN